MKLYFTSMWPLSNINYTAYTHIEMSFLWNIQPLLGEDIYREGNNYKIILHRISLHGKHLFVFQWNWSRTNLYWKNNLENQWKNCNRCCKEQCHSLLPLHNIYISDSYQVILLIISGKKRIYKINWIFRRLTEHKQTFVNVMILVDCCISVAHIPILAQYF